MTQTTWQFFSVRTIILVFGWGAFAGLLVIGALLLEVPLAYAFGVLAIAMSFAVLVWLWRRHRSAKDATALGAVLDTEFNSAPANPAQRQEHDIIKKRMLGAIATIKGSRLGHLSGDAALYELPWYMVIGNPAAGKSTAIANSGLQFPFAEGKVVQGVGGTRNCDWFFTTDGILLDTAGRFSVADEDRAEWYGFLDLLKKYRKKAPINGIIIAVSVAELTGSRPELALNLAKSLRMRVQELTERLEVHAPVYVVFTKADLICGFEQFFRGQERGEHERAWGATLPYSHRTTGNQMLEQFDQRFDELYEGLKDKSTADMGLLRRESMAPGVFTFPLEFQSIKAPLRAFIATLFEENPYQFHPVFRGFYFTSALQEGGTESASTKRVAERFGIELAARERGPEQVPKQGQAQQGYFLLNLFRNVIFADKDLVAQYASPAKTRLRYAAFFAATALVGLALGGWSWSYMGNRKLVANVEADLHQAVKLQEQRMDLQSRFNALSILQERIEQLEQLREARPLGLSLGLYQGDILERKLRDEYFAGLREVMLKPVASALEGFLTEVNSSAGQLQAQVRASADARRPPEAGAAATPAMIAAPTSSMMFKDASPTSAEDAYNALKTYLMLSEQPRAEGGHLNDQLTRFWRGWLDANRGAMTREEMIRNAERMISFYITQTGDASWPTIEAKLALVDATRDNLRKVVRGMPARERAYADVKARAATLFKPMTVASIVGEQDKSLILGSHAIPGSFTRDALQYVKEAFRDAASKELQSADWVLKTTTSDDLTLSGSPEQTQKALMDMYVADYVRQWQMFVQGVTITELHGFDAAASAMNRLGDPQISPLNKLITTVYEQTSWDNPSLAAVGVQRAKRGASGWFKEVVLRQKPAQINIVMPVSAPGSAAAAATPMGPVGREFSGVARIIVASDQDASLMRGYMAHLSKLRARFNTIKNQGDPGPGAKLLMQQTLDGKDSELNDALKFVEEQMLTGMTDAQKLAIRPILVRPLMQSFAVIIKPTQTEIDKVWRAQVLQPFQKSLATRFPFTTTASAEAGNDEIGLIFGPSGAIASFFTATVGPLATRRGDEIAAKEWAGMGVSLAPQVLANFPGWIAPLSAAGVANVAATTAPASEAQTFFDLQAVGATGATEFTIEIDGQSVRWKGQPQTWVNMVWPNPQGQPGCRITAITPDGRNIVILDEPGAFGLRRMVDTAKREKRDGFHRLSWESAGLTVSANLKVVRTAAAAPAAPRPAQTTGFKNLRLPETIIAVLPAAAPGGAQ